MDILTIIILLVVIGIVVQVCIEDLSNWYSWMCGFTAADSDGNGSNKNKEKFSGALQSLYSNDGIQDIHLTVNNDRGYGYGGYSGGYGHGYDGYRYWRGLPWYLPTRNLNRVAYYPYLYDYHLDRYGRFYPYW